ncbi:hypothetical protein [Nonomuraea candida]|uniref:hypothetical protein n=1 Tax=Nonomuraea candida TaxID=359159 RepID=UPI0005BAD26B|nr:hypothetical protein [Nonomuraea candida]
MSLPVANEDFRLSLWLHVREFAVPPSMIERATARRSTGDWAGACAAAHVDVDLNLRSAADAHGREFAARLRDDLRHLAPDLLRWHMPRVAPDGLLRPGLTVSLARYEPDEHGCGSTVHLVARTPPSWASAGQRISLALWDGTRSGRERTRPGRGARTGGRSRSPDGTRSAGGLPSGGVMPSGVGLHPHPRPHRRFRLDLHRHLWDSRRAGELRIRSGADLPPVDPGLSAPWELDVLRGRGPDVSPGLDVSPQLDVLPEPGWAVSRWAAEAAILLRAEGRTGGAVAVRVGGRRHLVLLLDPADGEVTDGGLAAGGAAGDPGSGMVRCGVVTASAPAGLPVLPDAATWVLPDLALLRAGLIEADRLHPLVAAALVPGHPGAGARPSSAGGAGPWLVECRGARHRIGVVDGVLVPLDHDPDEIRREKLLAALSGTPLPCLQVIDEAHRDPAWLLDVRARLEHGDTGGALAAVEGLLGADASLPGGPLRDELETASQRRVAHGLFRAGLAGLGPAAPAAPADHRKRHKRRSRRSTPR